MSHQFGWSSSVAGLVQSSFFWGYALSQLPGGWLANVFGGRVVEKFGMKRVDIKCACFFVYGVGKGELECCYYSNVTPIWVEFIGGWIGSIIFLLGLLPGGWLAKVFGGRRVLQIGVLTWSLATALVPLVAGFMPGLVFSRILAMYLYNLHPAPS